MSEHDVHRIVEIIHWIALGVMVAVYLIRLVWLFRFKNFQDHQMPGEQGTTSVGPALYSLGNVAMPWVMESTRKGIFFYLTFVIFHVGVVAGIFLAFVSSLNRPFLEIPAVANVFLVVLAAAFLVSVGRIFRRVGRPVMRLISTPDDYFSLSMLTVWFFSGFLAEAHISGRLESEWFLTVYLALTSFFLLYVPFSKISHYLYYPFTRYWIGRTLGHRGSMPATRG